MATDADADASPAPTRLNLGTLQTLATITLVVFVLYAARTVFIPIALAVLFVFILSPLVRHLERLRLPRTPAVLLTMGLVGGVLAGFGYVVSQQVTSLARELPNKKENIVKKIDGLKGSGGPFADLMKMADEIGKGKPAADPAAGDPAAPAPVVPGPAVAPGGGVPAGITGPPQGFFGESKPKESNSLASVAEYALPVVEPLATAAFVAVLVVFMLVNREDLRNRIIGLFGRGRVTGTTRVLADAADRVSTFLLYQLIVNATFGLVLGVGLYFIGVEYAFLWGVLSATLRFVPYIGTWISALFPFAISFAASDGWTQPLMVFGFFALLDLFTANVVEPVLIGHQTGVSPVALLIAAVFWAWLWGPIGLLLSVPITVCLAVIGQHVPRLRPLAVLIGDKPALSGYVSFYQRLLAKDKLEAATLAAPPAAEAALPTAGLATYDQTVIPALVLARRDKAAESITAEEEAAMFDLVDEIVTDAAVPRPAPVTDAEKAAAAAEVTRKGGLPAVVGAPAHHRAEELALHMLANGLPAVGKRVVLLTARQLPTEVEAAVADTDAVAVTITVLPPGGLPQAVYLVKRLRQKFPTLPIVVTYLGKPRSFDELLVKLRRAGATYVTTGLAQTADVLKGVAGPAPAVAGAGRKPVGV